jgi:F420-non-reducing hydrogenase iron-sulfur subunit
MASEPNGSPELISDDTVPTIEFEPKIIGFLCNWCSYAASDLAGISRIQLPPTLRIIRVMCTGSIDPQLIFEAYEQGLDGVIVLGCHPGDCHYLVGNYHAENKMKMIKKLLAKTDIEPERLHFEWVSAAEGPKFAEVIKSFTNQIVSLGPNPLYEGNKLDQERLNKVIGAKQAAEGFRLRAVVGREKTLVDEGNVYGDKIEQDKFDEHMTNFVNDEYIRNSILNSVRNEPKTVEQLSEELNMPTDKVFFHVSRLWKKQLILPAGHDDTAMTFSVPK